MKYTGTTDINAYREWKSWPEMRRQMYLGNAFCSNCGVTSFAPGFTITKDRSGLIVEGRCAVCGSEIARCCD